VIQQVAAINRVMPVLLLYVTFPGGAPTVAAVSGARTGFVAGDVTTTDHAAGDTSLTFAAGELPASLVPPLVSLADDVEIDRVRVYAVTNGWRVKTKLGATGTDCAFTLAVF
jgi:hypothetical protein